MGLGRLELPISRLSDDPTDAWIRTRSPITLDGAYDPLISVHHGVLIWRGQLTVELTGSPLEREQIPDKMKKYPVMREGAIRLRGSYSSSLSAARSRRTITSWRFSSARCFRRESRLDSSSSHAPRGGSIADHGSEG